MIDAGVTDTREIIAEMRKILSQPSSIQIEYISIVDAETLQSLDNVGTHVLAAVAVRIGSARLIDNILVDKPEQ